MLLVMKSGRILSMATILTNLVKKVIQGALLKFPFRVVSPTGWGVHSFIGPRHYPTS